MEELDPISLHNIALTNVKEKPSECFHKLSYLLQQPALPSETLANLLILYCQFDQYDMIADTITLYEELQYKYLTPVKLYKPT